MHVLELTICVDYGLRDGDLHVGKIPAGEFIRKAAGNLRNGAGK